MSNHFVNIHDGSGTVGTVGFRHGMSVAYRNARDADKNDYGRGTDSSDLSSRGKCRGDGIAEINMNDTRLVSVRTRCIMRLHVHATNEARHAGGGDTGRMVTKERE